MSEVLQEQGGPGRRKSWWLAGAVALVAVLVAGGWQLSWDDGVEPQVLGAGAGKATQPSGPGTEVLGAQVNRPEGSPPVITSGPAEGSTSGPSVSFTYTHERSGVSFQCRLDNQAFLPCPRSGVSYMNLPAGARQFSVAAQQGNGPLSAPAIRNWTVALPAPPPPTPSILSGPALSTIEPDATFTFSSSRPDVSFECRLDGRRFLACHSPQTYGDLAVAAHTFSVRAVDATGTSGAATYSWTITRSGFGISGDIEGLLAPGVTRSLNLVLTNPYNNAQGIDIGQIGISVANATVRDGQFNPLCVGPENVIVTAGSAWPVNVPRDSSRSLSELNVPESDWPQVTMVNLPTNQDACKSTTFTFLYTGSATK
jgi:hypothetical protein